MLLNGLLLHQKFLSYHASLRRRQIGGLAGYFTDCASLVLVDEALMGWGADFLMVWEFDK